jgi:hypothetical protein
MVNKYLLIQNNRVTNIVVVEDFSKWSPPEGHEVQEFDPNNPIGMGWVFLDGRWIDPYNPPA